MWAADAKFDQTQPDQELAKLGSLHSKYLTILSEHRLAMKSAEQKYYRFRKLKWEYYTGKLNGDKATLEKYGWEPFLFTLKSEVPSYLEADKELQGILSMKSLHEEVVEICTSILKELNSRTYQIRDFISWQKYLQGL
jgi:hypothetical protein